MGRKKTAKDKLKEESLLLKKMKAGIRKRWRLSDLVPEWWVMSTECVDDLTKVSKHQKDRDEKGERKGRKRPRSMTPPNV